MYNTGDNMILPRTKQYAEKDGFFKTPIIYDGKCKISLSAVKIIQCFSPDLNCEKGCKPNLFFCKKTFTVKGAYKLTVSESAITIDYNDCEGIRNAIASLVQLRQFGCIKCVEIFDEPDNEFRSCMLDLARGYVEIPVLKEHIVRMAALKFNYVHLHLMDRQSYALDSDVVPNPDNHRLYSKSEISELTAFCKLLCLEVIPEIEIPAHAVNQIKALPELGCDIADMKKAYETIKNLDNPRKREFTDNKTSVSAWVVCAGKETTYTIYEKIIKELLELFDGPYIHIGGDEIEFAHLGAHPHWDNCRACAKIMQENNLPDRKALYYYLIRRVYNIVKSCGKKMIMWNDVLDAFNPIDIPKDIVIEFWNGGGKSVYQKLLDQGLETINANYPYTYVDFPQYMQDEKIKLWNTHTEFLDEKELVGNIIGGEMCAWELGNPLYSFYPCTLPVCMALFADRVWNDAPIAYDEEYKQSIFSVVIGNYDNHINPFVFFKEIIPPRNKDKNMVEEIDIDSICLDELTSVLCYMHETNPKNIYGNLALRAYIECLESIKSILS